MTAVRLLKSIMYHGDLFWFLLPCNTLRAARGKWIARIFCWWKETESSRGRRPERANLRVRGEVWFCSSSFFMALWAFPPHIVVVLPALHCSPANLAGHVACIPSPAFGKPCDKATKLSHSWRNWDILESPKYVSHTRVCGSNLFFIT